MSEVQPPRVSIVVPAYNHADTLAEAINSLLAQDYPSIEIIVIDDGSTDNTREILSSYGDRIRSYSQQNIGQAATLNKGWALASGEVLGYLSADDFLYPGAILSLVQALRDTGAVAAYCDFDHVDPWGHPLRLVCRPEFDLGRVLITLDCPPGPGALFLRSAYARSGGWNPDLRQIPDFEFWLRLALQGKLTRVPKNLAAWRIHPGSQSFSTTSPERADEAIRVISFFFDTPDLPVNLRQLRAKSLARACIYSAQLHGRALRFGSFFRCIIKATASHPGVLLELQTWRSAVNALLSRPAHYLAWYLQKSRAQRLKIGQ